MATKTKATHAEENLLSSAEQRPVTQVDARQRRGQEEGESEGREPTFEPRELDAAGESGLLDPMQRVLWHEGGWARPDGAAGARTAPALALPALDALVDRFLRRVAFSGGKQRGVAHLEIGSGELAGSTLTISSEGDGVELLLDAPPGLDAEPYRALLSKRLAAKGVRATVRVR